nr:hypothetical protein [Delftia sp. PS-11]
MLEIHFACLRKKYTDQEVLPYMIQIERRNQALVDKSHRLARLLQPIQQLLLAEAGYSETTHLIRQLPSTHRIGKKAS